MKKVKMNLIKCIMKIFQVIFGIKENKVVCESFGGKQYSDSPRTITEQLHNMNNGLEIVWILSEEAIRDEYSIIPTYVKKVRNTKINRAFQIATTKVFITNENLENNIIKSKKQLFIQTWHGDRGFKNILYSAYATDKERPYPVMDNKYTDVCIAGSKYGEQIYRESFKYEGYILNIGIPRNDELININERKVEKIKQRLGIEKNAKVLLYAPTFRDNEYEQKIKIDLNNILKSIQKRDRGEWVILVRFHPTVKSYENSTNNKVFNVTDYPDMTDLLYISDFLITDYSSCACDFILTKKPIILYAYDLEEYEKKCRKFRANPIDTGFYVCKSEKELEYAIENMTDEEFENRNKKVEEFYGITETGKSNKEICNMIARWISEGTIYEK